MKELIVLAISASFALPGCITQSRISDISGYKITQIDSIIANSNAPQLAAVSDNFLPFKKPGEIINTFINLPADTVEMALEVDSLPAAGRVYDTGTQLITLRPIKSTTTGKITLSMEAVTKPKEVPLQIKIAAATPQLLQLPTTFHKVLFTIAVLGLAAQILLRWINRK